MPGLQFSRRLAIAAGVVLPLVETARRWSQLGDLSVWPFWLDDFAIGGFLLYGAWKTRTADAQGVSTLAAAWGFACGMGYSSFFGQLAALSQSDPSGIQSSTVVAIKGVMLLLALAALIVTLKSARQGR
jgi:hypothetical protein